MNSYEYSLIMDEIPTMGTQDQINLIQSMIANRAALDESITRAIGAVNIKRKSTGLPPIILIRG